ncbi:HEAT repeat-containing protein 5B [Dermatophagoides pteronyssinus]|uniref:HEAT repeat-containing protein 5B n=1 Tax=Dermatophagoides pteronyssinus TaxID=6956 RepID=A0ABQ8IYV7_DERPT|nr:HEAT repeat-containing protein 5B [Dermatophagoides pteronyssinus]
MAAQSDYLLNETELNKLNGEKKIIFVYDWLRHLSKLLHKAEKDDIKDIQKTLVDQLMKQLSSQNGNPSRRLIAKCLAMIFTVGDTFLLFDTVNKFIETLKNKDDSASISNTKLSSIICIGIMYENLGRLMGRTYDETVQLLLKLLKNADSQTRFEIYSTLGMIISGLGSAGNSIYRDVYKSLKHGMLDRSMSVRANAARCLQKLIEVAPFLYTTEIENVFSLCFRSFDGSNYEVRLAVAQTLGTVAAITQTPSIRQNLQSLQVSANSTKVKIFTIEEILNLFASGFLRGGIGFLKAGEMIKGSSTANREIRIGVIHSYVDFCNRMGYEWIERNSPILLNHFFEILSNSKAVSTHLDAIHSRRCITFILRMIISTYIMEKGQFMAIKELVKIMSQYSRIGHANTNQKSQDSVNAEAEKNTMIRNAIDLQTAHHILVVCLLEIGTLVNQLGASCLAILHDTQLSLIDNVCFVINHPAHIVRLSAAWCLRCICLAVNSQLTPLMERSLERLETLRASPESINGHSYVLSALFGTVRYTPLGIPQNKTKLIFNIAEDLLRTASQNSRLSMPRTQAGWQLMGAVLSLGPGQIKNLLPRLLLLWKNSFPRNTKELDSEKARGDAFTWQITLENRAGALAAMSSFLTYCSKLVTDEIRRRLFTPIESAITMLVSLNSHFKTLGPAIKGSYTMVRLRLYQVLLSLPPQLYENCFANLLRLLVSDLTLTENVVNTSSSLIRDLMQTNADIILGSWIQDTEHSLVEDQIQNHLSSGIGSIEYDPTILYKSSNDPLLVPSSPPLAVAVINKSAQVFALVFPYVAQKHRVQMLNHFQECLKHAKSSRQEAIQINILTAMLGALRTLVENKINLGIDEVRKLVVAQLFNVLNHPNILIRYAAAECLGRCVQTINDGKFLSNITQQCFEKLRTARDALTRTGYSLAIGCIHHYVVGMGSVPQLKNNISLLLALADDHSSPSVQLWALHALTLIVESGGPMFRPYVEPTLSQCLKILMALSPSLIDIHQSIAKCLSAIITTIGPEFQTSTHSIDEIRKMIMIACSILQEHGDFLIKSETIACLQQLHMFDRNCYELNELIFILCDGFINSRYLLRKASISCFQQIAQKDSKALIEYGSEWVARNKSQQTVGIISNFNLRSNHQFPGILVALLDYETNSSNMNNIKKILNCLVQHVDEKNLNLWITLCKEVLSASDAGVTTDSSNENDHETEEGDFEESGFKSNHNDSLNIKLTYRWQTRVFIMNILYKIIAACSQSSNDTAIHFDLNLAREKRLIEPDQDFLVLHLPDLVRMSFIGATSDCDQLRMEGLKTLELVIDKFAHVPEPEFENHVILEQYQAQVGAALRPAFAVDTPSHVTAMACQVCSAWIGSGVARDLNDLRRVHQLLVSSLEKLHKHSNSKIFNESASTMEKLAILKAWAEVYVVAMLRNKEEKMKKSSSNNSESLLDLVQPQLLTLSKYWIFALKDHALLTLPDEYYSQIPPDGSTFFNLETIDIVRPMYRASWPSILNAAALWLCTDKGFELLDNDSSLNLTRFEQFYLLFGVCIESLSNPKSTEQAIHVQTYLDSLKELIQHNEVTETILSNDTKLILELCQVLHRLLLTHEVSGSQVVITEIIKSLIDIQIRMKRDDNNDDSNDGSSVTGVEAHKSIVYSILEICLAILVRQLPQLCPQLAKTPEFSFVRSHKSTNYALFNNDNARIIANVLQILTDLCNVCRPSDSVTILPTILYLFIGVFCELSVVCQTVYDEKLYEKQPIITFLKCIKNFCTSPILLNHNNDNDEIRIKWIQLLQTAIARILDLSKTSGDEQKQDFISTLLAIGVFIIHSPEQVLSHPQIQYPVINLMTRALKSENELVQLKCIETLKSVFTMQQNNDQSTFYIHNLANELIDVYYSLVTSFRMNQSLSNNRIASMINILACLEILVSKANDEKRINMLYIYIPALISLLNVDQSSTEIHQTNTRLVSQFHTQKIMIHEHSLKKLTEIGPKYPDEFKQIMNGNPTYSDCLKKAIHHQGRKNLNDINNGSTTTLSQQKSSNENQSIKLKVDFSNYK